MRCSITAACVSDTKIRLFGVTSYGANRKAKRKCTSTRKAAEMMQGSEKLKFSWQMTCADICAVHLKTGECEENEIVIEDQLSVRNWMHAVDDTSAEETAGTLTLFRDDCGRELL